MSDTALSTCRSCGATIYWTITPEGKRMPVDPPPLDQDPFDERFNVETWRDPGDGVLRSGSPHPDAAAILRTTSHFATCPQADQWRKP